MSIYPLINDIFLNYNLISNFELKKNFLTSDCKNYFLIGFCKLNLVF